MSDLFKIHCFIALFGWYSINILGLFIPFIIMVIKQRGSFTKRIKEISLWFTFAYWYKC